jgi:glycosyltransferase involved in cell wall biosynthesis
MKYLFINTLAGSGSTGRIAADKCRELKKDGNQCVLAYGRRIANCDDIETYRIGTGIDCYLHAISTRALDTHGFGSKRATKSFLKWVDEYNPDVIWLHNIHGYYINVEMLFKYIKEKNKKVYWTLHDCWSFTGHCVHFTYAKCDKWKTGCYECCQKKVYPKSILKDNSKDNYRRKKQAFTGVKDLTIITPSNWLADLVKESFLKEYTVKVINNEIDTNIFKPTPSDFRQKYNLENKKIILGVASVWDERKGLKDYIKLADMLDDNYKVVLVGLNKKQLEKLPKNILGIPRTENTMQLAEIYTVADVYVALSYEETFGMTLVEAQACGTTVITYDSCAVRETLNENNKRNFVEVGDLNQVKKLICCL